MRCKIDMILSENRILQNESAIFTFILLLQASFYCLSILTCTHMKIKHVHERSKCSQQYRNIEAYTLKYKMKF